MQYKQHIYKKEATVFPKQKFFHILQTYLYMYVSWQLKAELSNLLLCLLLCSILMNYLALYKYTITKERSILVAFLWLSWQNGAKLEIETIAQKPEDLGDETTPQQMMWRLEEGQNRSTCLQPPFPIFISDHF